MRTPAAQPRRLSSARGQALIEIAISLPIMLLILVGIFEFARAYQTWQVLTNAAREGARLSVLPESSDDYVRNRVRQYLQDGQLNGYASANINVNNVQMPIGGGITAGASLITVQYPFNFIVLNPVARLVVRGSSVGGAPITITASSQMRNEAPY